VAQAGETCGPSSLATLLRFHGIAADPAQLDVETRMAGVAGALITDLAAAARRRGLNAQVVDLDLPALRQRILGGEPVVLLLDVGTWPFSRQHYVVAYGVTPGEIVVNSGGTQALRLPSAQLDRQWLRMGRLAIVAGRRR
jgi:ABC-type bacteriocin/lantibiotic exporter with double-glycine peptidase domain